MKDEKQKLLYIGAYDIGYIAEWTKVLATLPAQFEQSVAADPAKAKPRRLL